MDVAAGGQRPGADAQHLGGKDGDDAVDGDGDGQQQVDPPRQRQRGLGIGQCAQRVVDATDPRGPATWGAPASTRGGLPHVTLGSAFAPPRVAKVASACGLRRPPIGYGSLSTSSRARRKDEIVSGEKDEAKGRVKQAVGDLTDDKDMKREGKGDEVAGKAKQAVDDIRDKFKKND